MFDIILVFKIQCLFRVDCDENTNKLKTYHQICKWCRDFFHVWPNKHDERLHCIAKILLFVPNGNLVKTQIWKGSQLLKNKLQSYRYLKVHLNQQMSPIRLKNNWIHPKQHSQIHQLHNQMLSSQLAMMDWKIYSKIFYQKMTTLQMMMFLKLKQ